MKRAGTGPGSTGHHRARASTTPALFLTPYLGGGIGARLGGEMGLVAKGAGREPGCTCTAGYMHAVEEGPLPSQARRPEREGPGEGDDDVPKKGGGKKGPPLTPPSTSPLTWAAAPTPRKACMRGREGGGTGREKRRKGALFPPHLGGGTDAPQGIW